eukprot:TRINITY_DN471_c0_g1_i2.p2 TRINITY_DN471_c0_g1~~TRINITY_DN471_c0_g1_i2.p2  ORF type:complete len:299 (-),score=74.35 TRINITY_DN471_c0_g1_i2:218-1114(-)
MASGLGRFGVRVTSTKAEPEESPNKGASAAAAPAEVSAGTPQRETKKRGGRAKAAAKALAAKAPPGDVPAAADTPAPKRRRGAVKAAGDAKDPKDAKTPKRSPQGDSEKTPEKQAAPGKGMWWRCNRCSFCIPSSLKSSARCSRKARHIRSHGISTTAIQNNYLSRARMLRAVWNGKMERTPGGLTKEDLMLNDRGRVVPKKRAVHSSKLFIESGNAKKWRKWCQAHKAVRKEHGILSFLKVTKDGSESQRDLYQQVVEKYNAPETEVDTRPIVRVKVEKVVDTRKQTTISDAFGAKK